LHEVLISEDDGRRTLEYDGCNLIQPQFPRWHESERKNGGRPVKEGFVYASDTNPVFLTVQQIRGIVAEFNSGAGNAILRAANN
ncbi:MAG: hypothetical protein HZB83_06110, partial [Deltaproteobacteria bacterium]|nr:hypothetical protein [Deltaproteobacteria bacterium]